MCHAGPENSAFQLSSTGRFSSQVALHTGLLPRQVVFQLTKTCPEQAKIESCLPQGNAGFLVFFEPCNVTDAMNMDNQVFSRV